MDASTHTLLSSLELEQWILDSLQADGRTVVALPGATAKPLRVAIGSDSNERPTILRIYAWNATHGGGSARAADEFRIQLTSHMPANVPGEITVVIGWSSRFGVFAGWDAAAHGQRESQSPSLQVRQATLEAADRFGIAAAVRHSGDVVVAFRPELLAAYCVNSPRVHASDSTAMAELLNEIPESVKDLAVEVAPVWEERGRVARSIETSYRAWDFKDRILQAYEGHCAVCSTQLMLTEAAHIVPVAWPGSTDQTSNGLALCRNHHRAYDDRLLSVSPNYEVEISRTRLEDLDRVGRVSGADELEQFHGAALKVVPDRQEDRPSPEYLEIGRLARRWAP